MEHTHSELQKSKTLILKQFSSSDSAIRALVETGLAYADPDRVKNYTLSTGIRVKPSPYATPYRLERGFRGNIREWEDFFRFVRRADKLVY